MSESSSSWSSFFSSCFKGSPTDQNSSDKQRKKNKHRRSSSSHSSNSNGSNIPFSPEDLSLTLAGSNLYDFTLQEIKTVTRNLSNSNFVGSGGFGPVYKGFIPDKLRPGLEAQHVAVKYLDQEGMQGHREWLTEVMYLGQLRHPNLVKLIGYCCEEEHRMLVYEFMPCGNLENHLFKSMFGSLTWSQRMKIAVQTAKGLAFLHEAEKPIIYRDFKASNILLDSDYTAKLSDFGLAKDGPQGDATHVSTRVMGTNGYAAPEYITTGHLTAKSDVYSFGVVLLELLTGRQAIDKKRRPREQNLVDWARPFLRKTEKLHRIMDPSFEYSPKAAQKVALVAYSCLSSVPKPRPHMREVVSELEPILNMAELPVGPFVFTVVDEDERAKSENVKVDLGKMTGSGEEGERRSRRRSAVIHDDGAIGGDLYGNLRPPLYPQGNGRRNYANAVKRV